MGGFSVPSMYGGLLTYGQKNVIIPAGTALQILEFDSSRIWIRILANVSGVALSTSGSLDPAFPRFELQYQEPLKFTWKDDGLMPTMEWWGNASNVGTTYMFVSWQNYRAP